MIKKDMTPAEYAKLAGCSLQNITKHLRKKKPKLPGVISIKKYSRFYLLEVNTKEISEK